MWNRFNQVEQVHGWPPLGHAQLFRNIFEFRFFALLLFFDWSLRYDFVKEIPTISQCWGAELNNIELEKSEMIGDTYGGPRHNNRWLERILVSQEYVEIESLDRFIQEL